jgi:hypothetical protein
LRRFVPPLAVLQTLHAYPVASSQVIWGAYLMVLIAAICLTDGARQLGSAISPAAIWASRAPRFAGLLAAAVALAWVVRSVLAPLVHERALYRAGLPLQLPGSGRMHLPSSHADILYWVTGQIRDHCSTFISSPGLNSFYLWAGQEPPTSFNTTAWMYTVDAATQARIVERLRGVDRLCLVRAPGLVEGWQRGRPLPDRPLVRYLAEGFTPLASYGGYDILVRSAPARRR